MTTVNREQRKAGRDFLGRLATRWGWRTQHYPRPRPMDRALIAAHGKALTMLATTLQARGVLDVEDFAGTLGVFRIGRASCRERVWQYVEISGVAGSIK